MGALEERADALQDGCAQFEKQAAAMKNKFWLENLKSMIMMGVVAVIVLGLLYWKFMMPQPNPYANYPPPPPPPPPAPAPAAPAADDAGGDAGGDDGGDSGGDGDEDKGTVTLNFNSNKVINKGNRTRLYSCSSG